MWAAPKLAAADAWALLIGAALFVVAIFVWSRSGDLRYPSSNPSEEA